MHDALECSVATREQVTRHCLRMSGRLWNFFCFEHFG
jgi:hypothetical protein